MIDIILRSIYLWLLKYTENMTQNETSDLCSCLYRRWTADEARILRVSVSSFLDHLSLVMETMDAFGPPVSQ